MNEFAKPNLAVDQIPSSSVSDSGKALVVGQNGVPGWAEVGGGSSGGVLVVNYQDENEDLLNKTGLEIVNAAKTTAVLLVDDSLEDPDTLELSVFTLGRIGKDSSDNRYWFSFYSVSDSSLDFHCATLDDYPAWEG
jgi:hypothetical protein